MDSSYYEGVVRFFKVGWKDCCFQRSVLWWKVFVVETGSRGWVLTVDKLDGNPYTHSSSHHDSDPCRWTLSRYYV